ncbi:MAG: FeoA family protein, partial [Gemmatimonadales bacterium]|nr:FeoA family protein [Gemmatimonadales bacterium]
KYDPHGAPIPTREGHIEITDFEPLAAMEVGARVAFRQVEDEDPERLRYLKSLGLVPMVEMVVTDRQPFGGPITVRVEGKESQERVIGEELASCMLVERR